MLANRWLTIGAGVGIIALFIGVGILLVTLLGGDDLGATDATYPIPKPIGPPPVVARSAAADLLKSKDWDQMTSTERKLVESETKRAFGDATFRTDNGFILGLDVFRRDGKTLVSRQYLEARGVNGKDTGSQIVFYCRDEADQIQGYRYLSSALGIDFLKGKPDQFPPAWQPVMENTLWEDAEDLGHRKGDGNRKLRGLELGYRTIATSTDEPRRVQYWFDEETAQLVERGEIKEKKLDTDTNWYYLSYDELLPIVLPSELEQPDCVKDILTKIGQ